MDRTARRGPLQWTVVVPLGALIVLLATWFKHEHPFSLLLIAIFLIGAVLSAVHHAEVVAHRVGEPVGSLVLAVAVTVALWDYCSVQSPNKLRITGLARL